MRSFSEMFISFYVIAMTLSSERESIKYPVTKYSLGCYNFLPSFQKGCSMTFTSQVCYMLEKEKGEKNKQHLPPASRATVIGNIIQRYAPAVLSPTEMSEISCRWLWVRWWQIQHQKHDLCNKQSIIWSWLKLKTSALWKILERMRTQATDWIRYLQKTQLMKDCHPNIQRTLKTQQ